MVVLNSCIEGVLCVACVCRLYLEVNSVLKNQDAGTKILDEFSRPTCRSVYTVSDKHLRHGGSGYETM